MFSLDECNHMLFNQMCYNPLSSCDSTSDLDEGLRARPPTNSQVKLGMHKRSSYRFESDRKKLKHPGVGGAKCESPVTRLSDHVPSRSQAIVLQGERLSLLNN